MKRKWHKGRYGVAELTSSSEFAPRKYKVRAFDLRRFGVSTVPVVGQTSRRQLDTPSAWHVHRNCVEFVYCAAGGCEYESGGETFRLMPGMMFVSRADEEHRQINCPKGYATFYLHFRPTASRLSGWFAAEFAKMPRLFRCRSSVPLRFGKVMTLAESKRPKTELRIRLQTEVQSLLLEILDSKGGSAGKALPDVFAKAAERMRLHPERDYALDDLVSEANVSKSSYIAQFKAANGFPPHAYLLSCRVEAAKSLLGKGLSLKEVSDRLAFPTPQLFSRTFRHFAGLTPAKWCRRKII